MLSLKILYPRKGWAVGYPELEPISNAYCYGFTESFRQLWIGSGEIRLLIGNSIRRRLVIEISCYFRPMEDALHRGCSPLFNSYHFFVFRPISGSVMQVYRWQIWLWERKRQFLPIGWRDCSQRNKPSRLSRWQSCESTKIWPRLLTAPDLTRPAKSLLNDVALASFYRSSCAILP